MDLDVILRQVPALVVANQQMGAQIAELLAFKADAERRLTALEPEKPAADPEPVAEQKPEEHASEASQAETPAGEPQEAHEGDPAPTPAEEPAEASPDAPQAAEQP